MSFWKFLCSICCLLFKLLLVESTCTDITEYYHPDFGCKDCTGCMKGMGINLKQNIKRTNEGMMSCYSCENCQPGTYQNEEVVIKICKPCNKCENKKILRNCSPTENAICNGCLDGYEFKNKNGSIVCEKSINGSIVCEKLKSAETTYVMEVYRGLFIFTLIICIGVICYCIYLKFKKGAEGIPLMEEGDKQPTDAKDKEKTNGNGIALGKTLALSKAADADALKAVMLQEKTNGKGAEGIPLMEEGDKQPTDAKDKEKTNGNGIALGKTLALSKAADTDALKAVMLQEKTNGKGAEGIPLMEEGDKEKTNGNGIALGKTLALSKAADALKAVMLQEKTNGKGAEGSPLMEKGDIARIYNIIRKDGHVRGQVDEEDILQRLEAADNITIAKEIGTDWKFLAYILKFKTVNIDEIENNEKSLRDRAIAMLKCYEEKEMPDNRNLLTLALIEADRRDLLVPKRNEKSKQNSICISYKEKTNGNGIALGKTLALSKAADALKAVMLQEKTNGKGTETVPLIGGGTSATENQTALVV